MLSAHFAESTRIFTETGLVGLTIKLYALISCETNVSLGAMVLFSTLHEYAANKMLIDGSKNPNLFILMNKTTFFEPTMVNITVFAGQTI